MDHEFRKVRAGLLTVGSTSERVSREEFQIFVDDFAYQAMSVKLPESLLSDLQGWARSWYSLDQHVAAIEAYNVPKLPEPTDEAWNQTKQHVLTEVRRLPRVRALSYLAFDEVKWLQSSSAGYGYIGRKIDNDNYKKARKTAVTIAEKLNHDPSYGPEAIANSTPDVAFTRTQLSQIKVKTKVRNVWGEAFHYVLLEALFSQPLIEMFKEERSFYFIGRNPLFSVPALIDDILRNKDYVYMFDWSGFDASVQEWEIRFAFQCLESILSFPSKVESQLWQFIIELFIYRKISGPNGLLYLKTQGVPSGSCFTNIIGSIVNYTRIQYIFKSLTNSFALAYTHGDDSLAGVDSVQFIRIDEIVRFCEPLYWRINPLKSAVSQMKEDVTFLSRSVRNSQNYRDELTCLRMLMYPEYPVQSGDISALRAKSIYIDAGIYSQHLLKIYLYLKNRYGCATSLPLNLSRWDPVEFEARKFSASQLM